MYKEIIKEELTKTGFVGKYDTRHIESYMRIAHRTLDHLSRADFTNEVKIARVCIDIDGIDSAEQLAVSFGL